MSGLDFPKGFLWGAATAAHQVEGGNHNNWTDWENGGHTNDGSSSGAATDHWHLYKKDYQLLSDMHLSSYRFSVEWSRIEPREGQFNEAALAHYADMIAELKRRGITPVVTLHHFTNPIWFEEAGGWHSQKAAQRFERFVRIVTERLGEDVSLWVTINEPTLLTSLGYITGTFPPGRKNPLQFATALRNVIRAHKRAYAAIHEIAEVKGWARPTVMLAHHMTYADPATTSRLDRLATRLFLFGANNFVVRATLGHADAIGLNYYFYHKVRFDFKKPGFISADNLHDRPPASDLGWHINPDGLYRLLLLMKRYGKPIYITENGLADAGDRLRPWSIVQHLRSVHRALKKGVDVRGYYHWALTDTFEWDNGYRARYGLAAVDFATQARTLRPSGALYGTIAEANGLPAKLVEKYS